METLPRTPEWRERLRRVINKVGIRALRGASTEVSVTGTEKVFHEDPYVNLALQKHYAFVMTATSSPYESSTQDRSEVTHRQAAHASLAASEAVEHGFKVCGYILGYSVLAYRQHCKQRGTTPLVSELKAILLHKKTTENTVLRLALMPQADNKEFEDTLGLYETAYQGNKPYNYTPFEIKSLPDGDAIGIPVSLYIQAVSHTSGNLQPEPHEKCPAATFLPHVWASMVQDAASNPALFHASLQQ